MASSSVMTFHVRLHVMVNLFLYPVSSAYVQFESVSGTYHHHYYFYEVYCVAIYRLQIKAGEVFLVMLLAKYGCQWSNSNSHKRNAHGW